MEREILKKLHEIEKAKCIYNIHYCKAGVGFLFYYKDKGNWKHLNSDSDSLDYIWIIHFSPRNSSYNFIIAYNFCSFTFWFISLNEVGFNQIEDWELGSGDADCKPFS